MHCRIVEWRIAERGVAICTDGRLMLSEGQVRLILPAPAAAIWEDIQARRTAEAYARIYPGLHKAPNGIEPEAEE